MAASPQNEPVVFSQMLEALIVYAMQGRLNDAALRRIEAAGIDLSQSLMVAYPLTVWYDVVLACSELLFPDQPQTEALYAIGKKIAHGYAHTNMGKALFANLRVQGWQRAVGNLARALRTGGNFLAAHANELPGGGFEVSVEILPEFHAALGGHPGVDSNFMRGFLDASAELIRGAQSPTFTLTGVDRQARRATYLVRESA
ncbi:DUF2378 family protein [Hyalangium rubrum]|uniref:DUF2378 family protein n=1 Tax=Hyalangium rubrum TaxID=3103134 RepID=A0ABU5GWK2_9BACT|nr:DUF2378 family protein [Hyalangium sp. s54d21]MDY7225570.1 DUF2378 family protein [Hyalangium sp. s54d21]